MTFKRNPFLRSWSFSGWRLPDAKKMSVLLVVLSLLRINAFAFGQDISLSMKNASLEKVLKTLKKRSGYQFVYSNDLLAKANPVTFDITNGTIDQVLAATFENQPLTYTVIEGAIVIKPKTVNPSPAAKSLEDRKSTRLNSSHVKISYAV